MKAEPSQLYGYTKNLYKMRAEILDEQGKREEAIQNFQQSLIEYEKEQKQDIFWEISYWTSLGLTYIYGLRYDEEKKALERACMLAEKVSDGRE